MLGPEVIISLKYYCLFVCLFVFCRFSIFYVLSFFVFYFFLLRMGNRIRRRRRRRRRLGSGAFGVCRIRETRCRQSSSSCGTVIGHDNLQGAFCRRKRKRVFRSRRGKCKGGGQLSPAFSWSSWYQKKGIINFFFFFFKLKIIIYILSSSSPTNPTTTEFGDYRDQNSSSEAI